MKNFFTLLYFLTSIILRMSAFVNVVLIVVRTINITQPFYLINKKGVVASFVVTLLILLPPTIYDAVAMNKITDFYNAKINLIFMPFVGDQCIKQVMMVYHNVTVEDRELYNVPIYVPFLTSVAPFVLAVLITLACLGMVVAALRVTPPGSASEHRREESNKVTMTIALLSVIFSICAIIYGICLFILALENVNFHDDLTALLWTYVTSTIFPFICSALNPVILITRSKELKSSVFELVEWSKEKSTATLISMLTYFVSRRDPNYVVISEL